MQSTTQLTTESNNPSTTLLKKVYNTPRLTVHGDIAVLTQRAACGGNDGPAGRIS